MSSNKVKVSEVNKKSVKAAKAVEAVKPTKVVKTIVEPDKPDKSAKSAKPVKAPRLTKNEIHKKDQDLLFEDLKKIIGLDKNNSFKSVTVVANNDKITGEFLERIKKYHEFKLLRYIKGTNTRSSIKIVKKICEYHGYQILTKEWGIGENKGYRYYMIPLDDDDE